MVVDSGAAIHCCPLNFGMDYPDGTPSTMKLRSADGTMMPNNATRKVKVELNWDTGGETATIPFTVTNVRRPILSVSEICDHGGIVSFDRDKVYIERQGSTTTGPRVGNIYLLPGTIKPYDGEQIMPIDGESTDDPRVDITKAARRAGYGVQIREPASSSLRPSERVLPLS